jgi:hypothetical protein
MLYCACQVPVRTCGSEPAHEPCAAWRHLCVSDWVVVVSEVGDGRGFGGAAAGMHVVVLFAGIPGQPVAGTVGNGWVDELGKDLRGGGCGCVHFWLLLQGRTGVCAAEALRCLARSSASSARVFAWARLLVVSTSRVSRVSCLMVICSYSSRLLSSKE